MGLFSLIKIKHITKECFFISYHRTSIFFVRLCAFVSFLMKIKKWKDAATFLLTAYTAHSPLWTAFNTPGIQQYINQNIQPNETAGNTSIPFFVFFRMPKNYFASYTWTLTGHQQDALYLASLALNPYCEVFSLP